MMEVKRAFKRARGIFLACIDPFPAAELPPPILPDAMGGDPPQTVKPHRAAAIPMNEEEWRADCARQGVTPLCYGPLRPGESISFSIDGVTPEGLLILSDPHTELSGPPPITTTHFSTDIAPTLEPNDKEGK